MYMCTLFTKQNYVLHTWICGKFQSFHILQQCNSWWLKISTNDQESIENIYNLPKLNILMNLCLNQSKPMVEEKVR